MSDPNQAYGGPELIKPVKPRPGLFKTGGIVNRCLEPGLDKATLTSQVRSYHQRNYLTPFGTDKTDARGAYLYAIDQVLVAKVLATLNFAGLDLKDRDTDDFSGLGHMASLCLKAHSLNDHFPNRDFPDDPSSYFKQFGRNPASWVILDWERGVLGWSFHARWTIDEATERRRVYCKLWNVQNGFMPRFQPLKDDEPADAPDIPPLGEFVIPLDRILPVVLSDREAMN